MDETKRADFQMEEKQAPGVGGMPMLLLNIFLMIAAVALIVLGASIAWYSAALCVLFCLVGACYLVIAAPIIFCGLKVLKPNEAYVLTLFGKYYGTLKGPGFFFVNPFVTAANPASETIAAAPAPSDNGSAAVTIKGVSINGQTITTGKKKISLKAMTLSNDRQKINDQLGNPIIIGIVVIWKVVNTAKAVFNVDNYQEYLSIQCDSALRNIVRLYPYDIAEGSDESSLRGSSQEVAEKLKEEIQSKVNIAGLEITEARITHLAYAPEIAAAMLQRQQAAAIIDARKMIVDGAVSMVEMALNKLSEGDIVELDDERKAAMVSNLLVVLCGNKDAQPIVNSGSLY
ncbi:SPFH domain-containing protein [Bacilliculturomica massiliensis]|uniref:SPFH domain-containing protein n=1 Tax=Bacilliculturomica massiliensis TaxID=1917867 RepID=UPI001FE9BB02|nr:SPFH domain-containing protein [Bacilliculturomica massiliensis]